MDASTHPRFLDLASEADLAEGRGLAVLAEGRSLALFRCGEKIFAIDGTCPHRGSGLAFGTQEGTRVFCGMHGWEFDAETGACATNPAKSVATFPTRVANGRIWVQVHGPASPPKTSGTTPHSTHDPA